jgi:glycopeptide antibiotics resistance protein
MRIQQSPPRSLLRLGVFLSGLLGYGLLVTYWMLLGFGRHVVDTPNYNLVPFASIRLFLKMFAQHPWAAAANLIGNIVIFVPFGMLIPLVFGGGWGRMLLLFVCAIVVLECSQFLLHRGSLDVDDLLLNVVGALIGYGILHVFRVIRRKASLKLSIGQNS